MSIARKFSKKALAFDVYPHTANHTAAVINTSATGLLIPPQKSLVFLHGILGSKRNWRTPANVFRKLHPDFKCFAVDLRGHGDSHTTDDSIHKWEQNTVHNSAQDLHDLIQDTHIGDVKVPTILCAHSFGGKVALKYLERLYVSGHDLPNHTWIIDSLPGPYVKVENSKNTKNELQSVFDVIEILKKLPAEFESRDWMINKICELGIEKSIALWLGTNIKILNNKKAGWAFNLSVIIELFHDFCNENMWEFLENYEGNQKIHFIRAGKNESWSPEVLNKFAIIIGKNEIMGRKNILLHTMPHVGHWIHAEDLNGMLEIIRNESGLND